MKLAKSLKRVDEMSTELLPDELREQLPRLFDQETPDPLVYARFFIRGTTAEWYATEGQKFGDDFEFYGYIRGDTEKWGHFLFSELESARGPGGSQVERDSQFRPGKFTEIVPAPGL